MEGVRGAQRDEDQRGLYLWAVYRSPVEFGITYVSSELNPVHHVSVERTVNHPALLKSRAEASTHRQLSLDVKAAVLPWFKTNWMTCL